MTNDKHPFQASPEGNCRCGEPPLAECHRTNDKRREAVLDAIRAANECIGDPWHMFEDSDNEDNALFFNLYDAGAAHADSGYREAIEGLATCELKRKALEQALAEVRAWRDRYATPIGGWIGAKCLLKLDAILDEMKVNNDE